jgi:hypothetical protein
LANSLVNALQAKRRFVESLTHQSKYGDHETFLSPTIQHPPEESSKPAKTPQPSATPQTDMKAKKLPQKSQREIILTESEYHRIINLLESRQKRTDKPKQTRREENVPDWAKLAYASSNPNNQSDQYY